MRAEADAVWAAYGVASRDRLARRNGNRPREWDTLVGQSEVKGRPLAGVGDPAISTPRWRRSATGRWTPSRARSCEPDALAVKVQRLGGRSMRHAACGECERRGSGGRSSAGPHLGRGRVPAGWRSSAAWWAGGPSGVDLVTPRRVWTTLSARHCPTRAGRWPQSVRQKLLAVVPRSAQLWAATLLRILSLTPSVVDALAAKSRPRPTTLMAAGGA
jgi:hypothetical protein